MEKHPVVVQASTSQSASKYGNSAGKQCTGMSLAFSIHTTKRTVESLKRYDLDVILDRGNQIYEQCSQEHEAEILAPEQIPNVVNYDGLRYNVNVGQCRYGFISNMTKLTYQLTNVFCTYQSTFFVCKGYTIMLKCESGNYYMFDSHKKDKRARPHPDGKCTLLKFLNFHDMIKYLVRLYHSDVREQYDIVPLKLSLEMLKTGATSDIRCFFKRNQRKTSRKSEPDIMQIESQYFNRYTDNSIDTATHKRDLQNETFPSKRKTLPRKRHHYDSEMESSKRQKPNETTCTVTVQSTILHMESDCADCPESSSNVQTEMSDVYATELDNNTSHASTQRTRSTLKLCMEKKKGKWKIKKDRTQKQQKRLTVKDWKQVEGLQNTLKVQHGMKVTVIKENGVWKIDGKSNNEVNSSKIQSQSIPENDDIVETNCQKENVQSQNIPENDDIVETNCQKENVSHPNRTVDTNEIEPFIPTQNNRNDDSDKILIDRTETVNSNDNSKYPKKKRNLSMTPGAVAQRKYRLKKKLSQQNNGESCTETPECQKEKRQKMERDKKRNYRLRCQKKIDFIIDNSVNIEIGNNHFGNPCETTIPVELLPTDSGNFEFDHIETMDNNICNEVLSDLFYSDDITVQLDTDTQYNSVLQNEIENDDPVSNLISSTIDNTETNLDHFSDENEHAIYVRNFNIPLEDIDEISISNNENQEWDYNIHPNIIKRLNSSIEFVCIFCTKLCFSEQGKIIAERCKPEYRPYLTGLENIEPFFVCLTCKSDIRKKKCPKFSRKNNIFWPTKIPQLDILPHEERLIALRLPFMHIRVLPSGGQKSLRGNVINVPADIYEAVNMLPRYINDSGTVTVRLKRKLQYTAVYQEGNVRPVNILTALKYLLSNSPYYRSTAVGIDSNWLHRTIEELEGNANLEVDGNITNDETTNDINEEQDSSDEESDNFSEIDQQEVKPIHDTLLDIIPDVNPLNIAPGQGQSPLHILYDEYGEEMSFPLLYCGKSIQDIFSPDTRFLMRTR